MHNGADVSGNKRTVEPVRTATIRSETAVKTTDMHKVMKFFSVVTQRSSGALRDDTKNDCVAD